MAMIYLVQPNVDNASVHSAHMTLEGAKREAEKAARPRRDGFTRSWQEHTTGGGWCELIDANAQYRDCLYSVTPIELRDEAIEKGGV